MNAAIKVMIATKMQRAQTQTAITCVHVTERFLETARLAQVGIPG